MSNEIDYHEIDGVLSNYWEIYYLAKYIAEVLDINWLQYGEGLLKKEMVLKKILEVWNAAEETDILKLKKQYTCLLEDQDNSQEFLNYFSLVNHVIFSLMRLINEIEINEVNCWDDDECIFVRRARDMTLNMKA
ncbi:hypothetical protein JXO52_13175 [bacterium]|nr:hypothetical protein [bacterium]